ncbi:MAG: hypothetical protein AB1634_04970 [Thermodesulfobacteriota bacterium]
MAVWRFAVEGDTVHYGDQTRRRLTHRGCNEPFRDRYWCPKRQWFQKECCPFANQRECENFASMCGGL